VVHAWCIKIHGSRTVQCWWISIISFWGCYSGFRGRCWISVFACGFRLIGLGFRGFRLLAGPAYNGGLLWERNHQLSRGRAPGLGQWVSKRPPEDDNLFSFWMPSGSSKMPHSPYFANSIFVVSLSKY